MGFSLGFRRHNPYCVDKLSCIFLRILQKRAEASHYKPVAFLEPFALSFLCLVSRFPYIYDITQFFHGSILTRVFIKFEHVFLSSFSAWMCGDKFYTILFNPAGHFPHIGIEAYYPQPLHELWKESLYLFPIGALNFYPHPSKTSFTLTLYTLSVYVFLHFSNRFLSSS